MNHMTLYFNEVVANIIATETSPLIGVLRSAYVAGQLKGSLSKFLAMERTYESER